MSNIKETEKLEAMIVDDEALARKLIISAMDWEQFGIHIMAEAASALEAMAVLEEKVPDIIFMDIQMPYMDGLELSKRILKQYPNIRIVILTAHRDFDYAQKSIHIGISKFLLKPINPAALEAMVREIKEQITEEKRKWFELDHLKQILSQNYTLLRERFLMDYMVNGTPDADSKRRFAYYFPNGIPEYIQIAALETAAHGGLEQSEEERLLLDMKNLEYIKSHLKAYDSIEAFVDQKHHVILVVYSADIKILPLCEQLQQSIQQISGAHLLFGIGNAYPDLSQIGLSYQESLEALKYSHYLSNQTIAVYQSDLRVHSTPWHIEKNVLQDVQFYIKAGISDQLKEVLEQLYSSQDGKLLDLENAKMLSIALLSAGLNAANEIGVPSEGLTSKGLDILSNILRQETVPAIQHQTMEYLLHMTAMIASYRSSKRKSVMQDVVKYVQQNIVNSELTLNGVADHFHMNSSYLSRAFAKEMGLSFSKYLTKLRMEQAILLLKGSDLKAYQIAEAVGIPDAYYFSNCFKKYTGKSIRDYKRQLEP